MTTLVRMNEMFKYLDYISDLDIGLDYVITLGETFGISESEAKEVITAWSCTDDDPR